MLSERERAVLEIERRPWRTAGAKEAAALRAGLSAIRYHQILNTLTARTEAWDYAPQTLARVARLREKNRTGRVA